MPDVTRLTEQPGNKLLLHTVCHRVPVTEIVSWYHARTVSRAYTCRHYEYEEVFGIRLRGDIT